MSSSDWRLTANSSIYQEALIATNSIHEPACGFAKPKGENENINTLIKQNNLLIQLVVKLREELEDCKAAIRRLEAAKAPAVQADISTSLEELQQGLKSLSLGELGAKKVPKTSGKLFVFKNPKDIFDEEKRKLRK